jgi:predicted metal-dependent hydrolase
MTQRRSRHSGEAAETGATGHTRQNEQAGDTGHTGDARGSGGSGGTILQGGRAKAYRPMAAPERRRALEAGLEAYARGDAFLAHELLEPAWMGAPDIGERELLQGLIKLAAAFVHAARGNPRGVAKNLTGARERLAQAGDAGARFEIDVASLLSAIDDRLTAAIDLDDPPIAIPAARLLRPSGPVGKSGGHAGTG